MKEISSNFDQTVTNAVIKISGSLIKDINACERLADYLSEKAKGINIVLFPGGGEIDNYIEDYNEKKNLSRRVFHESTMLSLDQTALLFSNYSAEIKPVKDIHEIKQAWKQGKIPILMPSLLFLALDPFRYTNRVSSDSFALYFSYLVEAERILILKSIDGVLDENRNSIKNLEFNQFLHKQQNTVDETFPVIAAFLKKKIYILNGKKTENLNVFFNDDEVLEYGTLIQ